MTEQPEALRLAELLDGDKPMHCEEAAAELRRLHYLNEARRDTHEALGLRITALEQAGRQALEALGLVVWTNNPPVTDAITALRERLAPEEPTRAEKMREAGYTRRPSLREFPSDKPARQEPWEQLHPDMGDPFKRQEPVAWEDLAGAIARGWTYPENERKTMDVQLVVAIAKEVQLLYPAPQRREWVGLSDDEIERACVPLGAAMLSFTEVARAIEKLLKEKNQ